MDRIGLYKYTNSFFKRIRINAVIVSMLAILLMSNIAGATIYRWIPDSGTTVATGIDTNWGSCGSNPSSYVKTLLTDASFSGCPQDSYHESGTLDPAVDMFFNTAYTVDTNVQGNWYYGRLKDTSMTSPDVYTFELIYLFTDGTIGILPGMGSVTIPLSGNIDADYNVSLTGISGTVPAGAKPGLRISKTGNSLIRIYFGDTANTTGYPSGYFSVTDTPAGGDTTPPDSIKDLTNISYAPTFINWTWTEPATGDYDRVMIYLNEIFETNVTEGVQYYVASGLIPNTTYNISTRTVDTSGNVNQTWVNSSARTALRVSSILECVLDNGDGSFTAYFGYRNYNAISVDIPIGPGNSFSPSPANRGQPTTYLPGRTPYYPNAAFSVIASNDTTLVWSLTGGTSTASNASSKCDNKPPFITIISPLNTIYTTASIILNVSANEPISTWLYSLNGAPNASFTPPAILSGQEGTNYLIVYASDTTGNWNSSAVSFTVDSIPPDTSITSAPNVLSNSSGASFSFASTENGTFECDLDGAGFFACSSPEIYNSLSDGIHIFQVRAIDTAGNIDPNPASFIFTVDTSIPVITLTGDNPQTIVIGTAYTELGATVYDIDDPDLAVSIDASAVNTNLGGSYNVTYDAVDPAGNHAIQVIRTVNVVDEAQVDMSPPIINIISPQNILYITTSIPLNVSANEVILTWLYSLNGAPNVTFTPNTTITAVEGSNSIIVYANDTSNNWNSSSVSFTVSLKGTISGIVTNESSGLGISGATVKLILYPQYNATTLPDGSYTIPDVPNGLYDIVAEAAGYTKNSSTVNVAGITVTKDFSLAVGSLTGDYRYYSLIDNEITANKVSSSSDVGKSFTIPQYGNGVSWDTEVYVTDVSGFGATLTLDYYRVDGSYAITETPTVPAYGTYRWTPSDGTNGRPSIGKLVITSTNNIVGEFVISSTSNSDIISAKLYNSADYGTNLSVPQYGDNSAWDTYIAISDVSGLGANVTLKFYRPDGTLAVTETRTIPSNGMYKELPISDGKNGRPKMGRLEIESDHLITGEYRVYSLNNGGILSNKLYKASDKKTSFTVPQYGNHLTWDTYLAISDASGLGANLTIRYYYPNGTLAVTETRTVPANGLYKDQAISDGSNGRPTIGKLEIISDNIVFGELRIYSLSGRGIMSNSLYTQPDISSTVVVPYYGNNVGLGTKVNIADVSGLGVGVQVDYRYLNGVLASTEYLTIPADGLEAYVVSNGNGGKPVEGNMFISMTP